MPRKPTPKRKGGRGHPVFTQSFVKQAEKACEAGFTDRELADLFGVSEMTLNRWKLQHPDFALALKAGKESADARVERSLYHRAVGYSFPSEKIFFHQGEVTRVPYVEHVPPDTTAMIFWLKNRKPKEYRDRHDIEVNVMWRMTDEELAARAEADAAALGLSPEATEALMLTFQPGEKESE